MIFHKDLGASNFAASRKLFELLAQQHIRFAGNSRLKIYGTLNCTSGKRMKMINRVFFTSTQEAVNLGYNRPCGHCLKEAYKKWKNGPVQ